MIECYFQNVGGLRTKLDVLKRNFELCTYDIVMICEFCLNDDFSVSEVKFTGYDVYRCHRNVNVTNMRRGGRSYHSCSIQLSIKFIISNSPYALL